ncbi:MAG TPA: hypothetical protein DCS75_06980 [Gemmatimonadetes bacterium]|nr:hypothetical protein [Gemmatimonadota bacterium]HAT38220.1 hypothetical protein [Gemmatimonadota bacterium]HBV05230.1 hypothetical protein [Gemmatimonadota bacterium]HCO12940.1 hypothetical protein [Gemmatimonadota bacterium]|tara:strand:- start:2571 stop:2804 length:234 start_codon:yes stop_codon:yes gene_type:complete
MNNPMIKGEKTNLMNETSLYVTRATVEKIDGLHRRGVLEDGTTLEFGVHGPIKAHYGLESQPNLPLPVDYLVAAAAG